MRYEQAKDEIKNRWREFYPAAKKQGEIICPLCGHGKGGDGIKENPNAKNPNSLKCFGCDFTGDIIDLISQDLNKEFNEALEYAANQLGIEIERDNNGAHNEKNTRTNASFEAVKDLHQEAIKGPQIEDNKAEAVEDFTEYYKQCHQAINDDIALYYLAARGISIETANRYNLGFDENWISPTVKRNMAAKGNEWTPNPTARLIMPVSNNHYVARATDPTLKEYAKMNETGGGSIDIFNKEVLTEKHDAIFITESVIDSLSIIEAGGASIAINSTNNADKLLKEISSLQENKKLGPATLLIVLDNDESGKRATDKLISGLDHMGVKCKAVNICGNYKDPNEALTGDREKFKRAIDTEISKTDMLSEFLLNIQSEKFKPHTTGLSFIDDLLSGGINKQTLLLLMAAPGTGKTTLCCQMAEALAKARKNVIYLNLEMSREQMLAKVISNRCYHNGYDITQNKVLQGYNWTAEEHAAITQAIKEYRAESYPYIKYNPAGVGSDLTEILEHINQEAAKALSKGQEAPIVFVDYLHLISNKIGLDDKELLKQAVTGLKNYAIKYNTFVVAITATGRESNKAGRITLESGRDSSNIEYTADYAISLNYREIDNGNVSPNQVEKVTELQRAERRNMILRLLKSRHSAAGEYTEIIFNAKNNTFYGVGFNSLSNIEDDIPFEDTQEIITL